MEIYLYSIAENARGFLFFLAILIIIGGVFSSADRKGKATREEVKSFNIWLLIFFAILFMRMLIPEIEDVEAAIEFVGGR